MKNEWMEAKDVLSGGQTVDVIRGYFRRVTLQHVQAVASYPKHVQMVYYVLGGVFTSPPAACNVERYMGTWVHANPQEPRIR